MSQYMILSNNNFPNPKDSWKTWVLKFNSVDVTFINYNYSSFNNVIGLSNGYCIVINKTSTMKGFIGVVITHNEKFVTVKFLDKNGHTSTNTPMVFSKSDVAFIFKDHQERLFKYLMSPTESPNEKLIKQVARELAVVSSHAPETFMSFVNKQQQESAELSDKKKIQKEAIKSISHYLADLEEDEQEYFIDNLNKVFKVTSPPRSINTPGKEAYFHEV